MNRIRESYGVPLAHVYDDLDTIETENYILSKKEFRYPQNAREFIEGGMVPGDYVVLYSKQRHCVVMSDTPMERYTNERLLLKAKGDICILGLGIGMVIFNLFEDQALQQDNYEYGYDETPYEPLRSITVIEKDKELIDLIEPLIRNNRYFGIQNIELNIINADAYEYPKICNKHFDYVYADIWDTYPGYERDVEVFDELEELYSPICDEFDGWGYTDAHGDNPDDESPTERDDYNVWVANMIDYFYGLGSISTDIWDNIMAYAHAYG